MLSTPTLFPHIIVLSRLPQDQVCVSLHFQELSIRHHSPLLVLEARSARTDIIFLIRFLEQYPTAPMATVQPHAPARRLHTPKPTIFRQDTHVSDLAGYQMLPLEPRFVDPQNQPTDVPLCYSSPTSIGDWLRLHSARTADQLAFTVVDAVGTESCSWTWEQLWTRADKICRALLRSRNWLRVLV